MSKWIKVDPTTLKVGDKVKAVIGNVSTIEGVVDYTGDDHLSIGTVPVSFHTWPTTFYVRKPKRASVDCLNCGGQQCMSCALRQWHDTCEMDCPDCCGDTTPKPAPVRPDEPPVGSLFRINDSPKAWLRVDGFESSYVLISESDESLWGTWDYITEPGDTITLLELTEKGDKKDGGV